MIKEASGAALVLFSGGQDSTVCLGAALDRYLRVETVGFDYGQRHSVELACRQRVRDEFTFATQAVRYRELFTRLVPGGPHAVR